MIFCPSCYDLKKKHFPKCPNGSSGPKHKQSGVYFRHRCTSNSSKALSSVGFQATHCETIVGASVRSQVPTERRRPQKAAEDRGVSLFPRVQISIITRPIAPLGGNAPHVVIGVAERVGRLVDRNPVLCGARP